MLQYVRWNLEQIKERVHQIDYLVRKEVEKKIELAEIYIKPEYLKLHDELYEKLEDVFFRIGKQ